ncbi:MAG: tetratricopeptide repeat protein, partial [Acidobacteriota bacterium]
FDATEAALQRAAALYQSLAPNTLAQANTTTNLGVLALTRGHLEEASKYYRRALEIRQAIAPESLETAASWSNLGIVAMEQGDLAVAARYYRKALDIRRKVAPESIDLTNSLTTLGMLARRRGETREALARGHEALQILERIAPDSPEVASTLSSLGLAAWQHGDLAQAWDFTSRALSRHPADAPDTIDRATFFNNAAMIALDLGKLEAAEEHGLRALALYRRFAPGGLKMAATLFNLGQVAARRETLEEAWRYHHQALQIRQQLAPDSLLPAESLNLIAKLNRARGHHNDVSGPFERSITTLERQVGKLGGTQHRREGYRARYELLYRDFIAHLIDRRAWEEAFDVLERFRARSFLAMLAERDLGFDREAPEPLRRARRRIAVQYDRVQDQLAQLSPVLAGEKTEDLLRQLEALRRERDDVAVATREASPAGRTQPLQILTLAEARAVLDPGTVALSYSVGKQRTTLFVLRSDGDLESHTLTIDRDDLERQVELFRRLIQQQAPPAATGTEAADREDLGAQLYAALVRPAEARVTNARRLLIIPDGPLHMLPFGALQDAEGRYLVTRAALHTALSMTVYAQQLEARTADRQAATFDFVAFGDPLVGQEPTGPQLVASDPLDLPIQR